MVQPGPGILLIADPFLKDPNFLRTVVLLCEHEQTGTVGFVLNKKYELTLDQLIDGMEAHPLTVYNGGPVQPDTLHFLHQYPNLIPGSCKVSDDIYWGGNFETLSALIKTNSIDPEKIKLFVGYSGWGAGQLQDELTEKTWLTVPTNCNLVFHTTETEIWKQSLTLLGGEFERMIHYPLDPRLN